MMSDELSPALSLYRADQVRELDRRAIEQQGIPGGTLMARAGQVTFETVREVWPQARKLLVLAGVGNNAGDGFVVARLAGEQGLRPRVMHLGSPERLGGDALAAYQAMREAGIDAEPYAVEGLEWADVVVDAMLGTGLDGEVREPFAAVIRALNASGRPVVAVDIPSGLDADSGQPLGAAVRASQTVTFIGRKIGLYLADGPWYRGKLRFDDLYVPAEVYREMAAEATLLSATGLAEALPRRRRDAHKGDFGHLLVVGGAQGFAGAARMAGEAALRCGAGLVSLATAPGHAAALSAQRPELMSHPVDSPVDLEPLLQRSTVVALGPGLGKGAWAEGLWERVLETELPLLVDADGLKLLADRPRRCEHWVLTPHPGEAARLLGESARWVEQDRRRAVRALCERYGGVVVLKGAGTLVDDAQAPLGLCDAGNPGMASGGMGDVLSGVIAALLAQGVVARQAASLGVYLHAAAADRAVRVDGERGLLATDLLPHLRRLVNGRPEVD